MNYVLSTTLVHGTTRRLILKTIEFRKSSKILTQFSLKICTPQRVLAYLRSVIVRVGILNIDSQSHNFFSSFQQRKVEINSEIYLIIQLENGSNIKII